MQRTYNTPKERCGLLFMLFEYCLRPFNWTIFPLGALVMLPCGLVYLLCPKRCLSGSVEGQGANKYSLERVRPWTKVRIHPSIHIQQSNNSSVAI